MLREAARLHEQAARESVGAVVAAVDALQAALGSGAKVLIFGNGGSAADAQHFACELVGRFLRERRALAAIALTTDTQHHHGGRQRLRVRSRVRAADRSAGTARRCRRRHLDERHVGERARGPAVRESRGLKTVAFTGGSGGPIGAAADVHVNVPHAITPRVQEVHRTLIHAVCDLIEQQLAANP